VDPNTLNIPTFWRPTPEPLPAAAGMHRWVWDLRGAAVAAGGARGAGAGGQPGAGAGAGAAGGGGFGGRGGGGIVLAGTYTVKLTVNGKSYTQPLRVVPDPRTR
jgi:hypothetical protein